MSQSVSPTKPRQRASRPWGSYLLVAIVAAAIGAGLARNPWGNRASSANEQPGANIALADRSESGAREATAARFEQVTLPQSQWEASGIRMAKLERSSFVANVRLTGKVSLNEDRIAHIYPMVEGSVDSVNVGLGQVVQANDLLVVVHSREIGEAKLKLYQATLEQQMAMVKDKMQHEVAANAEELLLALREGESITDIERRFRNRSMGDYRERLLIAYSSFLKSDADVARLQEPAESGAISAKQLYAAQASRNADQATFQARIEQIDYELKTSLLLSSQAVKEAATRVAVAATSLRILGCEEEDIATINPEEQGEAISHYSIRAPFNGTVISKDVALKEQVRPDSQILSIADLSTVWITADIYEQNVPLLRSLGGMPVRVYNTAWPDRVFEAKVFYTGEIMDESTRTIALRAVAQNDDHLLKPGMFVTVELQTASDENVFVLPTAAVQEHEGATFVFIHEGDDEFSRRDIRTGARNESSIVIQEGLEEGELVVVTGGFILKSKMLESLMGEE